MQIGYESPRNIPPRLPAQMPVTRAVTGAASEVRPVSSPSLPQLSISASARALGSFSSAVSDAVRALDNVPPGDLGSLIKRADRDVSMGDWAKDARERTDDAPENADKERMAVARRAADFVAKQASPPRPAGLARENPFFGMSRADLAAIKYDESGRFTISERRAASAEASRQYGEWSAEVCARAAEERARTGKQSNFLREVLAYFEALPAVEQAATPKDYIDRLHADIAASEKPDTEARVDYLTMLMPPGYQS